MKHFLLLFLLCTSTASSAFAYLDFAPNENLLSEVNAHPYRVLPRGKNFAFAVDADFFKPALLHPDPTYYDNDYYHGNGYWLTVRAEYKPVRQLTLNLKTIFVHGTSSNGPTYLALVVPMLGVTYAERLLGIDVTARLSDIGRQTVGTGLIIEDKETDGGYVTLQKDDYSLKMMVDGTSSYRLDGGVVTFDGNYKNGLAGFTTLLYEDNPLINSPSVFASLYSRHSFSNGVGYGAEAGIDRYTWASLAYVEYRGELDRFHYWFKPQFRHYGSKVMGGLAGHVNHTYISYEQNDKPFTSFMNIMAIGDNVDTFSAQLNGEYLFNSFYRAFAELEGVNYDFRVRSDYKTFFYRAGFKFFLFPEREDHLDLLIGNKFLTASNGTGAINRQYTLPNFPDLENKPLFFRQLYFMANFTTKF